MKPGKLLGAAGGADKWHHLAPAAIIHFAVQFVTQSVKQGVQGLLPLAAIIFTAGEKRWLIISLIGGGVAVILLVAALLSYLKFRFRISGDTVLIQKGVFKRKRLSLPYKRIQNIAFKQPLYFRPFNLVVLGIESAGSSGEEISLSGISRPLAEEIRSDIFSRRSESENPNLNEENNSDQASAAPTDLEKEIIHQPIPELVRYGLSNNNIWVLAGLAAGVLGQVDWDQYIFMEDIQSWLKQAADQNYLMAFFVGAATFLAIIVALLLASVLGAIVTFYDFHLTYTNGRFHRTRGLFEKQEKSLQIRKIQSVIIKQPWPARFLKRFHVQMRQVGFNGPGQAADAQSGSSKFLIPSVTREFSKGFISLLYPDFDWQSFKLKSIDRAFTRKIVLWIMLPIAVIPTTILTYLLGPTALAILLVPFLLSPVIMLVRARYGYARNGHYGAVRSGFVGHKVTIFPLYKVQAVQVRQSPGQRKKELATLTIKLAGLNLLVPYMSQQEAESWRDQILIEVESHTKPWM